MASLRIRTRLGLVALVGVALAACSLSGGIDLPSRNDDGDPGGGIAGPGLNSGAESDGGAGGLGGAGGGGGNPEAGGSP